MEIILVEVRGNICFVHPTLYLGNSTARYSRRFSKNSERQDFFQTSLEFLGHIVSVAGIQVDPDKTKPIEEFPLLNNNKDVQ